MADGELIAAAPLRTLVLALVELRRRDATEGFESFEEQLPRVYDALDEFLESGVIPSWSNLAEHKPSGGR